MRHLIRFFWLLPMLLLPMPLLATSAEDALENLRRDIAESRATYNQRQQAIQHERSALLEEIHQLRETNRELRQNLRLDLQRRPAETAPPVDPQPIADELAAATETLQQLRRELPGELPLVWQLQLPADPLSLAALAPEARRWLTGSIISSEVAAANGDILPARLALVGPFIYARAENGQTGLASQMAGRSLPALLPMPDNAAAITALVEGVEASVPVDPTQGDAYQLALAEETILEHLMKGGVTMVPLLLLATVALFLAAYKLLSLAFVSSHGAEPRIADILVAVKQHQIEDAFAIARNLHKPLGPVICEGLEHRDAPKEHIEELMYERVMAQIPSLERMLSPLAVCASVAPLLGLLGTVTGMIHTFRVITVFGTGDAQVLSGGISEALITTEVGLMIAVPALLLHAWLSRRVRKAVAATQQSAIMFVNGLKLRGDTDG